MGVGWDGGGGMVIVSHGLVLFDQTESRTSVHVYSLHTSQLSVAAGFRDTEKTTDGAFHRGPHGELRGLNSRPGEHVL